MRTLVRWYNISYLVPGIEISDVKYTRYALSCAAAARSELITTYTSYIAADLNAFFLCEKKILRKKMALKQNDISQHFSKLWSGVFQNTGIFLSCPRFLLSRLSVYYGGPYLIGPMVHMKTYILNHFYKQYYLVLLTMAPRNRRFARRCLSRGKSAVS